MECKRPYRFPCQIVKLTSCLSTWLISAKETHSLPAMIMFRPTKVEALHCIQRKESRSRFGDSLYGCKMD